MTGEIFLAPSHSGRWVHCPGSIKQIQLLPPEERQPKNEDQRNGDGQHLLLERSITDEQPPAAYIGRSLLLDGREYSDLPMTDRVWVPTAADAAQVDHAYQHVVAAAVEAAHVDVEVPVDIGAQLVTDELDLDTLAMVQRPAGVRCLGRLDVRIVSVAGGFVEVLDYKGGVRHVSEVGNLQQLLYLLAVVPDLPPEITRAKLTIVQPNSVRSDVPIVRTWEVPIAEVPEHRGRLARAAARCTADDAALVPGAHCSASFCPARGTCPALAAAATQALTGPAQGAAPAPEVAIDGPHPGRIVTEDAIRLPVGTERVPGDLAFTLAKSPTELTLDEIANVLDAEEMIRGWVTAVRKHAYRMAMGRTRIPRHKLGVGGRSRKWVPDDDELKKKLGSFSRIGEDGKAAGKLKKGQFIVESVLSPAQAEKQLKPLVTPRVWKSIEALYEWTNGPPVLVSESDSREEYTIPDSAEAFGIAQEDSPAGDAPDFDFLK